MRALISTVAALALAGCANYSYATDHYGDTQMVSFEHNDSTYRVFDKPQAGKLMITSSLGAAAGDGALRGLTFGIINNHPSEPVMHDAADAFLASTGRACKTDPGQLIMQPQWEFRYSCETVAAAKSAPMKPIAQ